MKAEMKDGECLVCRGSRWLTLEMCCNNPDNGDSLEKSESIEISRSDGTFQLTMEGPAIVTRDRGKGVLQFGRFRIPYRRWTSWYGNWCWEAATVSVDDAWRAVVILFQRGWRITEGPSELFDLEAFPSKELWKSALCSNCNGSGKDADGEAVKP